MRGMRRSVLAGCAVLCASAVVPGGAAAAVAVKRGASYGSRIFPDNVFTKADRSQVTGRRLNFRQGVDYPLADGVVKKACTDADYSICDAFAELNKLDGFDLQPRVVVPFTGAIKLDSVNDSDFFITTDSGSFASGLRQLTFDPATNTLAGISDTFLREDTTYRIHVTRGIRDSAGKRVDACGEACVVRFTTRTASGELVRIRRAMDLPLSDPNNAYALAGFPGASTSTDSRKLSFTQNGTDDVFLAATVAPSLADPLNGITRTDQVKADPNAPGAFTSSAVPNLIPPGGPGYYAFGSFLSPRYQYASSTGHEDDVPQLRARPRPRRRRRDRRRTERRRRPDRARPARRQRASVAQAARRARVRARADGRRQHGARARAEGWPRHPRRRDQPRRPGEDHVLRAELRRDLRDDAHGHRPALPPRPSQRAGRPDRGHRAAIGLPRRPGRDAEALA